MAGTYISIIEPNCVAGDRGRRYRDRARRDVDTTALQATRATRESPTWGRWEILNTSTHIYSVASRDAEPDQLHDARRTRVDVQHRTPRSCIQGDRCSRRRLKDDAPGDAELGVEYVRAGGKDYAADGGIGE